MDVHQSGKDTLVTAVVAGLIAKLVQDILGYIIIRFLPTYLNCVRIAGGLILTPEQVMQGGFWPTLLGFQIDLAVGIVVALATVLSLQRWGSDHYILKGAMVGMVSWAVFYNVLSRLLSRVYPVGSVLNAEIAFLTHLAFGISLTWSAVWFSNWFNKRSDQLF